MTTTRFNPTTNGPLHVGHIYNCLVNQAEGDKFLIRFDDDQAFWKAKLGAAAMQQHAASQLRDVRWMGIEPDAVAYDSQMEHIVLQTMAASPHWRAVYDKAPFNSQATPIIVSNPRIEPWAPQFEVTVAKVILDHAIGTDAMVRGLELLQENALYLYLCGIFGFPMPKMMYIPRLMASDGYEMTDVSKTRGDWKIADLRERGVQPDAIINVLRKSCLIDPDGEWLVSNVKSNPTLKEVEL